ncbi:IS701 family transposase [Halotia branconii]|uniref:IS701 family transposase n=1 Tax=Halotia branconii CENA392 TaxID=1539056 RepID=A0AAJ6NZ49_9CYAN|nr:IS701 family transposase [Halotia branconii]WGV23455.1 IS701 family transposase [Halotia branconii CENA392]WGV23890.1 IS701 family transposase [Halotia branconii CENA392]WGV25891.1 IS701 family transposase [Halotia branconii CENA392]WGV25987.1 IS701 family transposase [Halotia branconii CENA392]WGV26540.1 IS701 family transposase [Halotia branconii CENA392]
MKETTPTAMPPCFEKWCQRFDDVFGHKAQKREFRHYLGGLLGESERKNLFQLAENAVGVNYHRLHHFLTDSPWSATKVNERRLEVMNKCSQTKISRGFSLIIDDSGHRKSGNFTEGVGRQYIGEIGKTDNGIVVVTTHLYDGRKSLPLDIELYQHADSLPEGKQDPLFEKKTEIAIKLIDQTRERGYQPGIVIVDAGYGNNTSFLLELENRKLKYLGGIAKNRKVTISEQENNQRTIRIDELAKSIPQEAFSETQLNLDKPRKVWVATFEVEISRLEGKRSIAIVMNAATFSDATDIDYFITNVSTSVVTSEWIVNTYSQRNWVEVFYREAKGFLGLKEYQVRDKTSLMRHFILVFCAYTFVLWHQLTGGFRRRWATKPLNTFTEALEAFRTAISFRFIEWLTVNRDVFAAHKASFGFIWA